MNTYDRNTDIQEIPLRTPYFRDKVKRFLEANGLRMESLDSYYAVTDDAGEILAGAGIAGSVLKCLAVSESLRSSGMLVPLVSRIMSEHPGPLKVFTKPEYQSVFESMGFRLLASAPLAILLENGRGLEQYCEYLRSFRRPGKTGVIVMNANPFTLGHQYLIEKASEQVDTLFIIPVKEDLSDFPYTERLAMITAGIANLTRKDNRPTAEGIYFSQGFAKNQIPSTNANPTRIVVLEGSDYVISAATFPTYFLKDLSQAAETHMRLDLDLYERWIAPALGASVRFVGSEPTDVLTNRYNQLIPNSIIIPRITLASAGPAAKGNYFSQGFAKNQFPSANAKPTHADAVPVSASRVRAALERGSFREASALCPATTHPYLLAALAERALRMELETPMKPGLVCPGSCGAHSDMNYDVMRAGIRALRPFWSRMALASDADELIALGIEAEKAMMAATGGVNTHRGAIFCLGIALNAATRCVSDKVRFSQNVDNQKIMKSAVCDIADRILHKQLNNSDLTKTALRGARAMAADGYRQLFEEWLPYYESEGSELMTLLKIMSGLDDTCVVHRVGEERAARVKAEAEEILRFAQNDKNDSQNDKGESLDDKLRAMCEGYAAERISPGGAADMLALTIFIHSIIS